MPKRISYGNNSRSCDPLRTNRRSMEELLLTLYGKPLRLATSDFERNRPPTPELYALLTVVSKTRQYR